MTTLNRQQRRALARARMPARQQPTSTYSKLHALLANPNAPMPEAKRTHQLTRMHNGLHALETAAQPSADDWRVVSDAVNLLETMVAMGHIQDTDGLLHDAVGELAVAGARHVDHGQPIRLSGAGIQTIRAVLEDYAMCLATLPERDIIEAHRHTEARIRAILAGRPQPHDVRVVSV